MKTQTKMTLDSAGEERSQRAGAKPTGAAGPAERNAPGPGLSEPVTVGATGAGASIPAFYNALARLASIGRAA